MYPLFIVSIMHVEGYEQGDNLLPQFGHWFEG
jgi:hypothetical protein